MFTFQKCELLAEGKVLQHQAAATAKSANDGSAPEPKQVKHGSPVIADGILGYVPMLLKFKGGRNCDERHYQSTADALIIPSYPTISSDK